jgi:uracil-DNA glycosylase family 4
LSTLAELNKEIAACTVCALHKSRVKSVPGEGPSNATIMFIGEAPGYHENQQGRPFVGPAGQFLEELLGSIGLTRQDVFIANVVKCRPPDNRDPLPDEIASCNHFLDSQIELIKPKMIVTLGRFSMAKFFPGESISKIHGLARQHDGVICVAMYHPAAALHQPSLRRTIEADFKKIPDLLAKAERVPEEKKPPEAPQQLSLF